MNMTRRSQIRAAVYASAATLTVLTVAVVVLQIRNAGAAAPSDAAPAPATQAADTNKRLIGRWLRPDGGYVLTIRSIDASGKVDAAYQNPRPINVSRAQFTTEAGGAPTLLVELRDRNYPGNYYTLKYVPANDQLTGVYHHLGINQDFEVIFTRLPEVETGQP